MAAFVVAFAAFRTHTAKIWKEEAEAQKTRADRLVNELEEINERLDNLQTQLTQMKESNAALVRILSTIDPQKLEELRLGREF
ncbi:hypothetical protein ACR6C2_16865 [Streptomyces sp. INA 01156]